TLPDPSMFAVPDAPPVPIIGGGAIAQPEEAAQGSQLLHRLSSMPSEDLGAFIQAHPDSINELIAHQPRATDVTSWWAHLSVEKRGALTRASPVLVGNLDGIPYEDRNTANRTQLRATMDELKATIHSEAGRAVVDSARHQLKMLQAISDALGPADATPRRTLMSLDVTGQGRAAIVIGDLNTADYVSYLVPGMFFTIENQMGYWVDASARLYDDQNAWLRLFGDDHSTVATVAWIGYHTPNLTNVGGIDNADEGRDALASELEGLQAIRASDEPYTTVIAHSYGSTAALMALTGYNFKIDALAMVGSPGSQAQSVDELNVRNGNVYVGEAAWDPVPNSSYFGSDPGAKSYGAKPMGVSGALDSITGVTLLGSTGHNEYFAAGTESMRNFALIGINKGQYVTNGTHSLDARASAIGQ
ncbi:MAG: hypothetical protein EPN91_04505, partial [Salinibacterium sp.]